jgi:uncharacterized membrane protein YsdA (DUF1294 family)
MKTVTDLILPGYLLLINLAGFVLMGIDKRRARRYRRRIPERRLLAYAAIGGSVGCILGMAVWRHKTKHPKFTLGLPLILLLQLGISAGAVYLYRTQGWWNG